VMTGRRPPFTTITTGTLEMTGRRPQSMTLATDTLVMTGRRPQSIVLATDDMVMTGRRAGLDLPGGVLAPPSKPKFRLFRVVPLGAAGTNPFDQVDVRADVAAALTPAGAVTMLTLTSVVPSDIFGFVVWIQVDTTAQTLSYYGSGSISGSGSGSGSGSIPETPTSALGLNVVSNLSGDVSGTLDPATGWTVVSRNYAQPFNSAINTCTVLRNGGGDYYKLNIGLIPAGTLIRGFKITSLSGSRQSTQPSCP
ncbi:MAG: hypothetical protein Q8O33_08335, partial [Pseudomonadota bacterium]|nr:hypothetical protein [Pseudomonadota bacterium]